MNVVIGGFGSLFPTAAQNAEILLFNSTCRYKFLAELREQPAMRFCLSAAAPQRGLGSVKRGVVCQGYSVAALAAFQKRFSTGQGFASTAQFGMNIFGA